MTEQQPRKKQSIEAPAPAALGVAALTRPSTAATEAERLAPMVAAARQAAERAEAATRQPALASVITAAREAAEAAEREILAPTRQQETLPPTATGPQLSLQQTMANARLEAERAQQQQAKLQYTQPQYGQYPPQSSPLYPTQTPPTTPLYPNQPPQTAPMYPAQGQSLHERMAAAREEAERAQAAAAQQQNRPDYASSQGQQTVPTYQGQQQNQGQSLQEKMAAAREEAERAGAAGQQSRPAPTEPISGYYPAETQPIYPVVPPTAPLPPYAEAPPMDYSGYETGTNEEGLTEYRRVTGSVQLPPRVVSETVLTGEESMVVGERVVEHETLVPKRVVREDMIEKVVVTSELVVHESTEEECHIVREKIVEVAVPVVQEKIVEVPVTEYVERVVEVPMVVVEKQPTGPVPVEVQERVVEVPKVVVREVEVEVPEIVYEYEYEPVYVDVPEVRERIVVKEVPVDQYVDKPVPEYVDVKEEREVTRAIPVPVEAVTVCEFRFPKIVPKYTQVDVPVHLPRFVEVPMPLDCMDAPTAAKATHYCNAVASTLSRQGVSLCEIETLAHTIEVADKEARAKNIDPVTLINQQWNEGRLPLNLNSVITPPPPTMDADATASVPPTEPLYAPMVHN